MKARREVVVAVLVGLVGLVPPVRAQTGEKAAAAEALFDEGRALLAAGKFPAACAKFQASQELDPATGTLVNLADCWEKVGRTASAWAAFREAAAQSAAEGNAQRAELAKTRAAALEARLARLTIAVPEKSRAPGITVRRDGQEVPAALFGTAVPVDPGQHVVDVTAPGRLPHRETLTLADRQRRTLEVTPLEVAPEAAREPVDSPPPRTHRGLRLTALVLGITAGAAIVAGSTFGLYARWKWDRAEERCSPEHYCTAKGLELTDEAQDAASLSTILFGAGLATAVAAGAVWLLTPADEPPRAVTIAPTEGGMRVMIEGRF